MDTVEYKASRTASPPKSKPATDFDESKFYPSGAIAFFTVLVLLGMIIWFGIYFLMIQRS